MPTIITRGAASAYGFGLISGVVNTFTSSTAGTTTFTVPTYYLSFTVEIWGGGGTGGAGYDIGNLNANPGGDSTITVKGNTLLAQGGKGGGNASGNHTSGVGGAGGIATGGTININGVDGTAGGPLRDTPGISGAGANGGAGGGTNKLSSSGWAGGEGGKTPGGGGGPSFYDADPNNVNAAWSNGGGAGGGGYSYITFTPSTGPAAGTVLTYTIGLGGSSGGSYANYGANGQITFTWT